MTRIVLKNGRDRSVLRRHPWIFSGAIADVVASGENDGPVSGETVEVVSSDGSSLGYGSYSPASQIRVRMLSFDPAVVPDGAFVSELVARAVRRRAGLSERAATNALRLVNAESDALPGVVVDVYAGWAVCQFTSAGAEFWKHAVAAALMRDVPGLQGVCARNDVDVRAKEGLECSGGLVGLVGLVGLEPPERIEIGEGAVRFLVDVRRGHKTGFYLDQRDARRLVGSLAAGADVLNCFCYTGGFGLAAAVGGARHVTQVDVSHEALELAKRNAALTFPKGEVAPETFDYVEEDVFQYLRKCRDEGRAFDFIVLDPPKFAASRSQVMKAARGYKDINLLAMKLLRPNGVLATFSCSGAMTADLFDKVLCEAAADAQRDFQTVARTRQAEDHPVLLSFPEGLYLKGVVLRRVS